MSLPKSTPPALTATEITQWRIDFLMYFPYMAIAVDVDNGWSDADIEAVVLEAWYHIPKMCVKKRREIMYYVMAHLLLLKRDEGANFKLGNTAPKDILESFELGDMKVKLGKGGTKGGASNDDFWLFSNYGKRAKHLMKMCGRAMIGYIV